MKDGKPDDRFVYGDRPANRRTTRARPAEPPPLNAAAQDRLRKAVSRSQLGPPLALAASNHARRVRPKAWSPMALALLVSGSALAPLAVLSSPMALRIGLGLGSLLLLASAAWWVRRASRSSAGQDGEPAAAPLDVELLRQLDAAMEAVAAELPEAALASLLALKATLTRVLQLLPDATARDVFTMEDRLYVVECVRRYLPDTLTAYLRVPAANRSLALAQDRSATQVLIDQLQLIQQALEQRERKGAMAAGERLLQQQRFLEAKSRER